MQLIPFKQPSQWRQQIVLSSTVYILSFRWNALNEYWVMDILTRDETPIILGVKIVVNWNLLSIYAMNEKPLGDLVCQNVTGGNQKIRRFDMGQLDEIIYYVENELTDILAAINLETVDEV